MEYLFRGIGKNSNQWLKGDLNYIDGGVYIFDRSDDGDLNSPDRYEVIPETVGMFTGVHDEKGNHVYQDSILRELVYFDNETPVYTDHIVQWSDEFNGWIAKHSNNIGKGFSRGDCQLWVYLQNTKFEVVGNVHDHLLKK